MELPGINNAAGSPLETAQEAAGGERLQRLADGARSGRQSRDGLKEAAKQFEGVFLNTLMKAMRQTVPENKLFNSEGPTKVYQQMQDAEMAKALAEGHGGLGIADLIVRQFEGAVDREGQGAAAEGIPGLQPRHPVVGPPAPAALERYRDMSSVGEAMAARQKLRFFAGQQGTAVADTLQKFEDHIGRASLRSGVEASLILAVVMEESGGDPQAVSAKGAEGLMQLMPATAAELGVQDPRSPGDNLAGGAAYLARMLERFAGDLDLALAAYNAGPGNVEKAGPGIPDFPETRRYVAAVKARYQALGGGTKMANGGQ